MWEERIKYNTTMLVLTENLSRFIYERWNAWIQQSFFMELIDTFCHIKNSPCVLHTEKNDESMKINAKEVNMKTNRQFIKYKTKNFYKLIKVNPPTHPHPHPPVIQKLRAGSMSKIWNVKTVKILLLPFKKISPVFRYYFLLRVQSISEHIVKGCGSSDNMCVQYIVFVWNDFFISGGR